MTFKLNPNADTNGTYLIGEIKAKYSNLERAFGLPQESDGNKVSGEWVFTDSDGGVYTLYDWKATELYEDGLPSVEEFRAIPCESKFNIGGRWSGGSKAKKNLEDFEAWVADEAKKAEDLSFAETSKMVAGFFASLRNRGVIPA